MNSKVLLDKKELFIQQLDTWYKANHRKLPWRTTPSVYKTVVSEIMLQQTQVSTVLPYFDRWLKRFPDFQALADASEEDVVHHWEGLGYYSRARNLHKLAKQVITLQELPTTADAWKQFPGVGPYTAAAIGSIAFNDPIAVIDGNVIRILARLVACQEEFKSNIEASKAFDSIAQGILNHNDPDTHNQAMMELGATICTKQNPSCDICPVSALCEARKTNSWKGYPKLKRKKIIKVDLNRAWVIHNNQLLLHRIPENESRLANLHELPNCNLLESIPLPVNPFFVKKRSISTQRITESIYKLSVSNNSDLQAVIESIASLIWVSLSKLAQITLSGPHRRWIHELITHSSTIIE